MSMLFSVESGTVKSVPSTDLQDRMPQSKNDDPRNSRSVVMYVTSSINQSR